MFVLCLICPWSGVDRRLVWCVFCVWFVHEAESIGVVCVFSFATNVSFRLRLMFLGVERDLFYVCFVFVLCLFCVCFMFVLCLFCVCFMFVSCLFCVCFVFVWSMKRSLQATYVSLYSWLIYLGVDRRIVSKVLWYYVLCTIMCCTIMCRDWYISESIGVLFLMCCALLCVALLCVVTDIFRSR